MTTPRTPGGRGRPEDGDPGLERSLRAWLAAEHDTPPATLASGTSERVRHARQLPGWLARLLGGAGGGPTRTLQLGGVMASIAVAVVALGLAWGAATGPAQPSAAPTASTGPSASPQASAQASPMRFDGRGVAVVQLKRPATALGAGFGSLWIGDAAGRLLRLDPGGGSELARIELGGVPCGPIVAAAASLWLTTCGDGGDVDAAAMVRIDPSTNAIAGRFDDGLGAGAGAAAMNGMVWFVSDVGDGGLTAVDATTGELVLELTVGRPVRHLTAGFGSLWVSVIGSPEVLRLDPVTGARLATVTLSGDPAYLLTTSDAIWVAEPHQWLVARIDPVTDRVAAEIGASPGVDHLVVGTSGRIWSLSDTEAMAIDPVANATADRFAVPPHLSPAGVAADVLAAFESDTWFADGTTLFRIAAR